jgi:hypothetical protein
MPLRRRAAEGGVEEAEEAGEAEASADADTAETEAKAGTPLIESNPVGTGCDAAARGF